MLRDLGKQSKQPVYRNTRIEITEPRMFMDGCFPNESRKVAGRWYPDEEEIRKYIERHGSHPGAVVKINWDQMKG